MNKSEQEVPQRKSLSPTLVELIVCAGFALLLGYLAAYGTTQRRD
jgi:hypothetical protein